MEKKQPKTKQKLTSLQLRSETLHRLEASQLRGVIGGARMWKPSGFAGDTTPLYDETGG
jgi:hypothetical protein